MGALDGSPIRCGPGCAGDRLTLPSTPAGAAAADAEPIATVAASSSEQKFIRLIRRSMVCIGNPPSGFTPARNLLRQGAQWPTSRGSHHLARAASESEDRKSV